MIRMTQVKISASEVIELAPEEDVKHGFVSKQEESCIRTTIAKLMQITQEDVFELTVERKSVDARKSDDIYFVYAVTFKTIREHKLVSRYGKNDAFVVNERKKVIDENKIMKNVALQIALGRRPKSRPVVIGMGPAGLFAALGIAQAGLCPIVIERGSDVSERQKKVDRFWETGILDPECNVQFGEGGAGTFSDGKLNTMVKDPTGKIRYILETFVNYGAPEQILYEAKPHVGTDRLKDVVRALRERILALGGEIFFDTRFERPIIKDGAINGVVVKQADMEAIINCDQLVIATGHSARDTFRIMKDNGLYMEKKPFAVGLRVQHAQEMISKNQYGDLYNSLPAADYKVTYNTTKSRGVYSFCMCPGGYVVNASSVPGQMAVNGMSYYERDSANANSAIVVTVGPNDFKSQNPLAGMLFQENIEKFAYDSVAGKIPTQLYGDYVRNKISTGFGSLKPECKGDYAFANLRKCLPELISDSIIEGMNAFEKFIPGFSGEETILMGVESRTSSPVRMTRNEEFQANIRGIYPCGEGAGYAGGIMSAAMDGLKVSEKIIENTEII